MWQRFNQQARETVFYAQQESQRLGSAFVSTEHLLLGLLRVQDSAGVQVLEGLGINIDSLSGELESKIPKGTAPPNQEMTLTPSGKEAIDLAYKEST